MLILVYTSHRSCLYQSLVLVYTRRSLVTPVASWWGALLGPIHSCRVIPASLVGRARAWSAWLRRSWLEFFISLAGVHNVQHRGWSGSSTRSGCFRQGGVNLQPHVWSSGAGQQWIYNSRPLLSSLPYLSIGTSQLVPRRQPREGLGRGLLESR